ncbi:HEAVY METAL ASSOCIATED PROTEIN 35 [Hibiscus trionum]|uniref:HEAVY METAL ASSOCIATED PROTEIN 35 n=1 Tax=Hibiscus trionum TaxID=183268 RepID=A0A9W7H823_HIBTR|nr:HEAVY METAL ASSOCIATED PROTEIN 35 [Hibiscus trionum]
MAEKVTIMVLKVDLQCRKCYKKVKKVLCKFPQIRDQVYDNKANTVTIRVVCCDPERLRDKLCCKGGGSIKSIEIKPPPKPPAPEKPKPPEKPKAPVKPKEPEKPKAPEKPKEPEKPKAPEKPKTPEKPKEPEKPKQPEKPKEPPALPLAPAPKPPEPSPPPPMAYPAIGCCCTECYRGIPGGPCYYGGPPPPPCYGIYGRPVYDNWGWGCGDGGSGYSYCYTKRTGECFSDENSNGCSIM